MGEISAIGEVIGSAALARAVEPNTGAIAADGHTHEAACLNCATPLTGAYCHACGQRGHVHRTLSAFFHDLLHGVFHFEGKIWATLPRLAWRPGELTRDYIEGKRARFVSPLALFLFSMFLMFAVVSMLVPVTGMSDPKTQDALRSEADGSAAELARLKVERAKIVANRQSTTDIDSQVKQTTEQTEMMQILARDGVLKGGAVRVSDDVPAWLSGPLRHASQNTDLMLYKVQNNAYKYSWALIPLSLPFMWLLFPFSRRFRLYDHLVFVTYSLCFMTMLVIVATLLAAAGWPVLAGLTMIVPPLHIYRQLKGAYDLRRFGALWRTAVLTLFAIVTVGLFLILLFALGIF